MFLILSASLFSFLADFVGICATSVRRIHGFLFGLGKDYLQGEQGVSEGKYFPLVCGALV
jgi:hypothetical protein